MTWVAILALLMQSLLPTVAHAVAPSHRYLTEICTAFGIKKVQLESGAGDTRDARDARQHCPVCSLGDAPALPVCSSELALPVSIVFELSFLSASQEYRAHRSFVYLRGPPPSV